MMDRSALGNRFLLLATTGLLLWLVAETTTQGADFRISPFGLSSTNTFLIGIPSDTNSYYVLRRGSDVTDITTAAALALGGPTNGTLVVPLSGHGALFRLQRVPISAPLDTDGDGMDDVFELRHPSCLSPLNPNDAALDSDGDSLNNAVELAVGADPCASNTPPSVSLHSTTATNSAPGSFLLEPTVADADGHVVRVDFFAGTNFIGSATSPPFSFNWTNVAAGIYSVTARAIDNHTLSATSAPISITVTAGAPATLTGYTALGDCFFAVFATVLTGTDWALEASFSQIGPWAAVPGQPTIQGTTWTYSIQKRGSPSYVRLRGALPGSNENFYSNLLLLPACN